MSNLIHIYQNYSELSQHESYILFSPNDMRIENNETCNIFVLGESLDLNELTLNILLTKEKIWIKCNKGNAGKLYQTLKKANRHKMIVSKSLVGREVPCPDAVLMEVI